MPLFYSGQANYIQAMNAVAEDTFSTAVAATVGGTTTLDLSTGGSFFVTMGAGNTTLAFSAPPTTAFRVTVYIKQDSTGSRLVSTWPTGTSWPAATAPTLTTTGSRIDIVEFRTVNSGTTWYARVISQNHI